MFNPDKVHCFQLYVRAASGEKIKVMKTELFKKVFIKSEEDLPKEKGDYYALQDDFDGEVILMSFNEKTRQLWLDFKIIWYLQPLPDEPELRDELLRFGIHLNTKGGRKAIQSEEIDEYLKSTKDDGGTCRLIWINQKQ